MKAHKVSAKRKNTFWIIAGLIFLAVFAVVFFIFFYLANISSDINEGEEAVEDRNYHVLVVGNSENASFLSEVFHGAEDVSQKYKTKVELYVPESRAEDISFQELLDYASFTNADGIIAYVDVDTVISEYPRRYDETPIPIVTVGHYSPSIKQASFIGNNYSEAGKKIAEEAVALAGNSESGKVCVMNSSETFNSNYSTLMNSFQNVVKQHEGMTLTIMDEQSDEKGLSLQQYVFENFRDDVVLVCLNENDIIKSCQTVMELGAEKKVKIIGFGSNEVVQWYFDRGIISELVLVNTKKIGEEALRELFEYRNKGYANSFVTADVEIRKQKNEVK